MDYEKKYNEALNWMRELYPGLHGATKEDAEHYFPELRESENERIRKRLIDFISNIKGISESGRSTWAVRKDDAEMCNAFLLYLEKQKELPFVKDVMLGYPGLYFYDGERMHFRGSPAMEEKHKENPKSADSIPTDCTSDAKCEDRWHKVTNSLPDNPREVLCKDEAGNSFIGRYYVGEGWEISNYDNEDKPHHLNPPVLKWIDLPSEKQKEQKPAEDKYQQELEATDRWQEGYEAGYNAASKPTEWSEKDEQYLLVCKNALSKYQQSNQWDANIISDWLEKRLKSSYQPKQEWSEEDEKALELVTDCVYEFYPDPVMKYKLKNWLTQRLKSLRPQPHWKPSEEQVKALKIARNFVVDDFSENPTLSEILKALQEQLEKQM